MCIKRFTKYVAKPRIIVFRQVDDIHCICKFRRPTVFLSQVPLQVGRMCYSSVVS